MSASRTTAGFHRISHDRPLLEQHSDAYRVAGKLTDPTVCPQCHAVFHNDRWQWLAAAAGAQQTICPACHRINDHYPAGYVTFEGDYFKMHRDEIMHVVNNHAEHQRAEHPLKRVMHVEIAADFALITTTDIHLARGIAEAVHHACQGELELQYNPGENQLRAYWQR
jgi:hypothetical protein